MTHILKGLELEVQAALPEAVFYPPYDTSVWAHFGVGQKFYSLIDLHSFGFSEITETHPGRYAVCRVDNDYTKPLSKEATGATVKEAVGAFFAAHAFAPLTRPSFVTVLQLLDDPEEVSVFVSWDPLTLDDDIVDFANKIERNSPESSYANTGEVKEWYAVTTTVGAHGPNM